MSDTKLTCSDHANPGMFLRYDPDTGELTRKALENRSDGWNKRYANQPAGFVNNDKNGKPRYIYGAKLKNGLVVKDNALMNASYNLEVTEQRLILLAIISARETGAGITSDSKLEIYASDYSKQFNVTKEASYKALKSAVNNLFERQFSFQEQQF